MRTLLSLLASLALLFGALSMSFAVEVTVNNPGTLTASGDGLAHVRIFQGTATVTGKGMLRVSAAAQVQITGDAGQKVEQPNKKTGKSDWVVYRKFNGTATITGDDVHVFMRGKGIQVNAQGAGRVHLIGTGTFTIQTQGKAQETGNWTAKPTQKMTAEERKTFEKSARHIYGDYTFKNGKEDVEGDANLL